MTPPVCSNCSKSLPPANAAFCPSAALPFIQWINEELEQFGYPIPSDD